MAGGRAGVPDAKGPPPEGDGPEALRGQGTVLDQMRLPSMTDNDQNGSE